MKIIILGPQGSGKGTQAQLMSEKLDIPHISTGDIFRDNIRRATELGKKAEQYSNNGKLVPDEFTIAIVKDRLLKPDCANGFILDGFPRNLEQARALESITGIDRVLDIQLNDDIAVKRISSRRTCKSCGAVYSTMHDDISKGCVKCGGELYIRDDDRADSVKERLKIYHKNTEPLIDHYQKKGILLKLDGSGPIKEIFNEIIKKL